MKYFISLSLSILLFGCFSENDKPSQIILKDINKKNIIGEENIILYIKDIYKRSKYNITKKDCELLSTESSDDIDKLVINIAKKNCKKPINNLDKEFKDIINNINKNKSLNISFDKITDVAKFKKLGFSTKIAKLLYKKEIKEQEIIKLSKIKINENNLIKLLNCGISIEEIIKWNSINLNFNSKSNIKKICLKKIDVDEFIKLVKNEIYISLDDYINYKKNGIDIDFLIKLDKKIGNIDFKKFNILLSNNIDKNDFLLYLKNYNDYDIEFVSNIYFKYNITSYKEVSKWVERFGDLKIPNFYFNMNIYDFNKISKLSDYFAPKHIKMWLDEGFSFKDIYYLFSNHALPIPYKGDEKNKEIIKSYKLLYKNGYTLENFIFFENNNFYIIELIDAKRIINSNINFKQLSSFIKTEITNTSYIVLFIKYNIEPLEAKQYIKLFNKTKYTIEEKVSILNSFFSKSIFNINEINYFINENYFTNKEKFKLIQYDILSSNDINFIKENKINLEDLEKWLKTGIDFQNLKKWLILDKKAIKNEELRKILYKNIKKKTISINEYKFWKQHSDISIYNYIGFKTLFPELDFKSLKEKEYIIRNPYDIYKLKTSFKYKMKKEELLVIVDIFKNKIDDFLKIQRISYSNVKTVIEFVLRTGVTNSNLIERYYKNGNKDMLLYDVEEWIMHDVPPEKTSAINKVFLNTRDFFDFLKKNKIENWLKEVLIVSNYIKPEYLKENPKKELLYWYFFPHELTQKDIKYIYISVLSKKMNFKYSDMKLLIDKKFNFKNGKFTRYSFKQMYKWYKKNNFTERDTKILIDLLKKDEIPEYLFSLDYVARIIKEKR